MRSKVLTAAEIAVDEIARLRSRIAELEIEVERLRAGWRIEAMSERGHVMGCRARGDWTLKCTCPGPWDPTPAADKEPTE